VCKWSGKKPRPFCIHKEYRDFLKEEEPTELCDVHDFKRSGQREEMCSGSLGMFISFYREAWKKENQEKAEEDIVQVLGRFAIRDIKYSDFFMWCLDNKPEHAPINDKGPYHQFIKDGKRTFDLSKWDERYWELFERFVYLHSLFGIIPVPQMFMDRYCDYAFKNNVNGVRAKILSNEALPYCYRLSDKTLEIVFKYFNEIWVKFINEPRHGNDEQFHMVAVWHRKMFDNSLKKYFDHREDALASLITDNSGSEGGQMLLVWHAEGNEMKCPKCKRLLSELFPDLMPEKWMRRLRTGEQHSTTMIPDFEKDHNSMEAFFRSANRKCRWHEDGSYNEDAKGVKFGPFQLADAKQYGQTCDFAWSKQVAEGKGRKNYMVIFPLETLLFIDGVFYETYNKDIILWDRYDEMYKAHMKNFG